MKKFIRKLGGLLIFGITIIIVTFYLVTFLSGINYNLYSERFLTKVKIFENDYFLRSGSINLIMGSSYIETSINGSLLNDNWYVFANGGQNVYESYKFLKYYIEKVKIDSIIIGISPFDFPFSYLKNRYGALPVLNGNFCYFGHDSITSINYKRKIQDLKDQIFRFQFISPTISQKHITKNQTVKPEPSISETYEFNIPNLDINEMVFKVGDDIVDHHIKYFYNVNNNPSMKYFDLFYHLTKENNINLICLITPKSSFWRNGLIIEGNGKKWNNVIDSLKLRDVTIWNYENLFDEKVPNNYFANEDHSTLDGANIFTQIIVEKLKDQSLEKDYFEP